MKKAVVLLALAGLFLVPAGSASAEFVDTVFLNPVSPDFQVSAGNAHTWVGDPDIWNVDLTGYAGQVSVFLKVDDFYPPYPDDYDLYWNDEFLGNSESPVNGREFVFNSSPSVNSLKIEYVNRYSGMEPITTPGTGGSWYNMTIRTSAVPEPISTVLFAAGGGVLAARRLRKKDR